MNSIQANQSNQLLNNILSLVRGRLPSCLSPFSIHLLPFGYVRIVVIKWLPASGLVADLCCQADEILVEVLGCDQKVQKLSTDIILYTCN
jgi:hypothetical protein